jgi:hypothetical protein
LAGQAARVTVADPHVRSEIGEILHSHAGIVKAILVALDPSGAVG